MSTKKKRIGNFTTVRLDLNTYDRLVRNKARTGRPLVWTIRAAVDKYLLTEK